MKIQPFFKALAFTLLLCSCATQKVAYFEDIKADTVVDIPETRDVRLKPGDKISILINSKDPQLMNLFNLPYIIQQLGQMEGEGTRIPRGISGYTVDPDGAIDFPVLGKLQVEGMNRAGVAEHIKKELVSRDLVKDPVVTVEFMNLTVAVLGEVNRPGRFVIEKDKMTLLDAISMAGDLTIHGRRDNVLVQREIGEDRRKIYRVDLNSGQQLYSSPVFYLQQNDVVYVEPNKYRTKDATINSKAIRRSTIWLTIASIVASITIGIAK